ncbi:Serine/threonine-protein kinase smu1 [Coemansia spiralis]|uniref:WD40 repeat-containing protein SMU1 n=2 Tax=Coemansia TaxID=4863 RepID=A0A9W8G8H0_9FUNG|nr:Serine/threonine-protein kinase smu1 [Coemansia umbellata]KAJ2622868.1 Serine/threonine-protein kinase smu1 [Coemansia sp. RSA 1358]KAJ2678216.1 Serine/threonine-protein kinase smu1 [Coemansia spiralis]
MDIESSDIIRLIQQFLKEHNLRNTLDVLQSETGISLNTVDNIAAFKSDILKGRWDTVLTSASQANLLPEKLVDLYEQIIIELAEAQDIAPARALLRQTEPMEIMRQSQPERYLSIEQLLSRTSFDPRYAYKEDQSKESRRKAIAEDLIEEVSTAPPSRLIALLGQSIKWQIQQGLISDEAGPYDLFYGRLQTTPRTQTSNVDKPPHRLLTTIKFPKKQHPNSIAFSPNGAYLATGSADGFIELWNYRTGKLASDLKYQKDGALMMMEESVTSLAFSPSNEFICSGAKDGKIKLWKVKSGSCAKRFPAAHSQHVSCVAFSKDEDQVLSGGFDHILRIHGLKSGKMLKEFRGHTAPVTSAIFSEDNLRVISASEDGSVRIWDASSTSCLHTVVPGAEKLGLSIPSAHTVLAIPGKPSECVVCTKSLTIYVVDLGGSVKRSFSVPESAGKEFLTAAVTCKGKYVLAVSDAFNLHCFDIETGFSDNAANVKVTDEDVVGMACHPSLNITAFFSNGRRIPIWTGE